MKLTFVGAFENAKNGAVRVVFRKGDDVAIVLKTFGPDSPPGLRTVKVWSLKGSSLQKTMSYWNTKTPVTMSYADASAAEADVWRILNSVLGG